MNYIQDLYHNQGESPWSDAIYDMVIDILKERHPYELPKITVLEPVFTLPEYEKWINNSTT